MAKAVTLKNTSDEEIYPVTDISLVNGQIPTARIADDAVTSDKIDWTTLTSTDYTSSFTWDSGISTSSVNDRKIILYKMGNMVSMPLLIAARSNYQWTTSWLNVGTLPEDLRPVGAINLVTVGNNRDSGQPLTAHGKIDISTEGLIRARFSASITNAQLIAGGAFWFTA